VTATATPPVRRSRTPLTRTAGAPRGPKRQTGRHIMLGSIALLWLVPLLWAVYTSLRSYSDTTKHGYLSWPHSISLQNFSDAWSQSGMPHFFWNSVIITIPAVLGTLLFAAAVAFFVSRFDFRWNVVLLMLFTAGNLIPAQVLITPLYRLYLLIPLPPWMSDSLLVYNSLWGIIFIHIAYQCGFCTFVLSNYMKTIPKEIFEAALVDGAPAWRQFFQIVLPLCRPAFAALATLESIWIYNDFFWSLALIQTGDKRPITSALANLQGQYFTNPNLIAAGALMTAIPTLLIYFALQRQFISGLTIGSGKG
jgi:multiple sugar transport system permease protein